MKRILILIFSFCIFVYNGWGFVHVVQKGETIVSIAEIYGVPKTVILKANPGCEILYIGLKLTIPIEKEEGIIPQNRPDNTQVEVPDTATEPIEKDEQNVEIKQTEVITSVYEPVQDSKSTVIYPDYEFRILAGLSMNNVVGDDIEDSKISMGFHIGLGARYYLFDGLFVDGSLLFGTKGYKKDILNSSGSSWDDEGYNYDCEANRKLLTYNIDFIPSIGYKFGINNDFGISLKVGPYVTYALSGNFTEERKEIYYPDIHSSETEYSKIKEGIGDVDGYKKFGYGIDASISLEIQKFVVSLAYQRAFSDLIEDMSMVEQNLIISLGYRF